MESAPDHPDNASRHSPVGSEDVAVSSDSTTCATPTARQITGKPAASEDLRSSHQHGYHYPHHSASGSRLSSAKTSSSSLQALNEDVVTDARSDNSSIMRNPLVQRVAQQFGQSAEPLAPSTQSVNTSGDFPVYPDQSYAVLQSQVHPTPYPFLRSRSSYPVHSDISARYPNGRGARTAGNTPISSPGLFSSRSSRSTPPYASDDEGRLGSPYLHPTHLQPPKETHTVEVDRDVNTGNKLINEYEILEELGRGEHGKVKLGRHVVTKQQVAIKIVQRYSKRRRLGKLGNPEDKVKKEVAILKKARHPNVVSLLEVIDDPNRQKVYIVLEYVENGEIVWRKKGLREIVNVDKRRLEREKRGIPDSPSFLEESLQYVRTAQLQRRQRERARARRNAQTLALQEQSIPAWSLEHGGESDDEAGPENLPSSSRTMLSEDHSVHSSPSHSYTSTSDLERRMREASLAAIEGSMYGPYASDHYYGRRFSTASSNLGYASSEPDWLSDDDDLSYVPCLTMSEARNAFRDSVLGLEYLHYQGIIHRDIKPANLLVTANHRVKISDFGVSYLGRPMRDDEEEQVTETDASELDDARELSKTVGTPAFYAPELCYTGDDFVSAIGNVPKITGAIDVWSLGVTLYGMIFGRLPFMSDDEFSMFQTIVKQEVFIPRKRLKAVEEDTSSTNPHDRNHIMNCNKRTEDELVYEDIDDELYDLLKRLLTKDPTKRITLKEIKHHPWVLRGLQNPRAWIEETDPGYQSKGKRIEVSTEEVTTAVSKVPFIQRVRSNVAKWSGYITGRSREGRKRATSNATSADSAASASSSGSLWRDWSQVRRQSLRGDEEPSRLSRFGRESDHPLSQSVTASPDGQEDQPSYLPISRTNTTASADQTPRPPPPQRATSSLSSTESTKTVRASDPESTPSVQPRASTPSFTESLGASSISGIFSGAGRRLAKSFQTGEWRPERSRSADRVSVDGDARSEPSLALSVASARGEVQATDVQRDEAKSLRQPASSGSVHRRHRSHQLAYGSSVESFQLAEALLRQKVHDTEHNTNGDCPVSRPGSELPSDDFRVENDEVHRKKSDSSQDEQAECGTSQDSNGGLTTSPPSATTISSSVDDYNSGISQSASHRSIPSVLSRASSLSGDIPPVKEKEAEKSCHVPAILRTGDTVKAIDMSYQRSHEDDESKYYCDDEEDDSEDEGIVFGRKTNARRDVKINK
ncbi:hypothetical protein DTO280E4_6287 [Paecilomyces variotii]|nr:hypothetical protein DTO280E4_6287 [Paecilomyces variotii]KAJ9411224.1 hypothetical protein DTO045G8_856 [Paecilomyces variotii]